jgi:predicted nucleic acid-binding protein
MVIPVFWVVVDSGRAQQFSLANLYDAALLAVAELESAQFWTAEESLLNTLTPCPGYVQKLEA